MNLIKSILKRESGPVDWLIIASSALALAAILSGCARHWSVL